MGGGDVASGVSDSGGLGGGDVASGDLAVVDCRWYLDGRSGRAAYDSGHIPGAVFADVDSDLAAPASLQGGRHPLPDPADFAAAMGRLGIGDSTRVVAYDDAGGVIAGRLWWMLDVLGRPAAVLDGGIDAWTGELSTEPAAPEPAAFTPADWPAERVIATRELFGALGSDLVILDARSVDRYAQGGAIDARPGHIPGAVSAPATHNLRGSLAGSAADSAAGDPADMRLRSAEDLAERYRRLGVPSAHRAGSVPGSSTDTAPASEGGTGGSPADNASRAGGASASASCEDAAGAGRKSAAGTGTGGVVAYCGSGVSACLDLLALRRAGLPDGRLYVGSWSAWGADADLPAELGDPAA